MNSAPPRTDQRMGWPLALPVPPAVNSTRSGWPRTSAADQVPWRAGLPMAVVAKKSAKVKATSVFMIPPQECVDGNREGRKKRGLTPSDYHRANEDHHDDRSRNHRGRVGNLRGSAGGVSVEGGEDRGALCAGWAGGCTGTGGRGSAAALARAAGDRGKP